MTVSRIARALTPGGVLALGTVALLLGLFAGSAAAQDVIGGEAGTPALQAGDLDQVVPDAAAPGPEPDTVFTSLEGRFTLYDRWERECNIGELRDCSGNLVAKIGSDNPNWDGWDNLDGRWIRAFGELAFLPSECGKWFNITDPDDQARIIYDEPCTGDSQATATPSDDGGGVIRECIGPNTTATFTVRSGGDDVVWSRQRGLESNKTILRWGGDQLFHPTVGLRFTGASIPKNAKIQSAVVRVVPAASSGIDVFFDVYSDYVGSSPPWSSSHHPGNIVRSPNHARMVIERQWTGRTDCRYVRMDSDISVPIQDAVAHPAWFSGASLGLAFEWRGPFAEAAQRPSKSVEGGCAPRLEVTWCPARVIDSNQPLASATPTGTVNTPTPVPTATCPSDFQDCGTATAERATEIAATQTPDGCPSDFPDCGTATAERATEIAVTQTPNGCPSDFPDCGTATAERATEIAATQTPDGCPSDFPDCGTATAERATEIAVTETPDNTVPCDPNLACATETAGAATRTADASTLTPSPTSSGTASPTATATLSPDVTATPTGNWCDSPYDLNDDGQVDVEDIDIIVAAFGSQPGDPNWNPDADVNGDQVVDLNDYLIVREHFGPACPVKGTGPA